VTAAAPTPRFPIFRLLVITGAVFVSVSSEFLPTGLLPDIAGELHVSESRVGLLVTLFAFTVVLSTAPLTALTHRFPRKWLMVATLAVFAVANVLAAISPSYEFLAGARILGGLAHGLFWSVTGPYASRIVPRHQLSRALAVTNAGGTAAFILGVPLGTALGHALGWRLAFGVMAGVVLLFLLLVIVALPPVEHIVPTATGEIVLPLRRDRTVPAVVIVAVTIFLFMLGYNSFYIYIVPWATQVGTVPPDVISVFLLVYGAAGAVGLLLAGIFGDRYPRAAPLMAGGGIGVGLILLAAFGPGSLPAVFVFAAIWSVAFGAFPPLMHARMLHSASLRLRDTAAAWTTIAFNLAIGGGAFVGGVLLDHFGIRVLPWAGVVIVLAGFVFVLVTDRRRIAIHPG
jgi:predicted MFS family arabinose efflux permease